FLFKISKRFFDLLGMTERQSIQSMFTPRHIKHSRLLLRHARKYLRYKHDKLGDADRQQIVAEIQLLREALRSRDRQKIHSAAETLDKTLHKLTPVTWESH